MPQKRSRLLLIGLVAVLALSGCNLLSLFDPKDEAEPVLSFAETLVEELGASLDAASGRSARALTLSLELTASQVSSIKAAALSRIRSAGKADSENLDELLPLMIEGVKAGTEALRVETAEDFTPVLVVAARSAVSSASQAGREGNVSEGMSISEVLVLSVETAAVQIEIVTVGAQTASLMADVAAAVVEAIDDSGLDALDAAEALTQVIAELASQAAETGDSAALAAVMSSARSAIEAASADISSPTLVENAATAAAAAVAAVTDATEAADLLALIAVQVPEAQGAIETAATDAGVATGSISAALSEADVDAVARVKLGLGGTLGDSATITSEEDCTVYLDEGGSTGAYRAWAQVAGPGAGGAVSSPLSLRAPGTYIYELTVKNSAEGFKRAADRVTVIVQPFVLEQAESYVQQGIQYLAARNFGAARDSFTAAYGLDGANNEAKIWKALLDTASLAVNATAVSTFRDRMGLVGYPSSLNAFLSDTWFSDQWYGTKFYEPIAGGPDPEEHYWLYVRADFVAEESCDYVGYNEFETDDFYYEKGYFVLSESGAAALEFQYDSGLGTWRTQGVDSSGEAIGYEDAAGMTKYDFTSEGFHDLLNPLALLPEVRAPSWASGLGPRKTVSNYPVYIIANVIDRNPAGFNAILDGVLSGPFGSALDAILAEIEALPEEASVTVPASLIAAYADEVPEADTLIGKPELLAYAGQLRIFKSMLQLISSYDFSYPFSVLRLDNLFYGHFGEEDAYPAFFDTVMPLAKGPFVISSNTKILQDRSQTTRNAARASLSLGLADLVAAATELSAKLEAGDYDAFIPPIELVEGEPLTGADLAALVDSYMADASSLKAAVDSSTVGFVLPGVEDDLGNPTTTYPGKLFDSAVFSLPALFEYETVGSIQRPVLYGLSGTEVEVEPWEYELVVDEHLLWEEALVDGTFDLDGYALRFNKAAIEALWPEAFQYLGLEPDPVDGEYYLDLATDEEFDPAGDDQTPGYWALGRGPGGN